jgi:hypothetical protein
MASLIPDVSQIIKITPEQGYTLISVLTGLNLSLTTIKAKEFNKKIFRDHNKNSEMGDRVVKWQTTYVTGTDVIGKQFCIRVAERNTSDGAAIKISINC